MTKNSYIIGIRPTLPNLTNLEIEFYVDMWYEVTDDVNKKMVKILEEMKAPLQITTPPTIEELIKEEGITGKFPNLNMMKTRAKANPGTTIHCIHTKFKLTEEDFSTYLKGLGKDPAVAKFLKNSRVG